MPAGQMPFRRCRWLRMSSPSAPDTTDKLRCRLPRSPPNLFRIDRRGTTMTPHAALRAVAPSTGWSDGLLRRVSFNGGADPILPTPFRIGAAGAAAIAASGLAAAGILGQRSGGGQGVGGGLRPGTGGRGRAPFFCFGGGGGGGGGRPAYGG